MRNVINHGMFVCEICEQELLDELESEIEEGVCSACIGRSDEEDVRQGDFDEDFYPIGDDNDFPRDDFEGDDV